MTWGFQIVVRLPRGRRLSGEAGTWDLGHAVGLVTVDGTPSLSEASEIVFRGTGFESEAQAQQGGETLRWWLRVAGVSRRAGFDFGKDQTVSGMGAVVASQRDADLAERDAYLVPDVHGLTTFEEIRQHPVRFSARAEAIVSTPLDLLRAAVIDAAELSDQPHERESLASDLVALSDRETTGRGKLIALATALEVLSDRHKRTGVDVELVERFNEEVKGVMKDLQDENQRKGLQSLQSSLSDLRNLSITQSIRNRAAEVLPGDPAAAQKAAAAYNCRSQLVHTGRSDAEPEELAQQVRPIVEAMIRSLQLSSVL
jgi:hypothetical protein